MTNAACEASQEVIKICGWGRWPVLGVGGGNGGLRWVWGEGGSMGRRVQRIFLLFAQVLHSGHTGGMVECGGIGEWASRPGDV